MKLNYKRLLVGLGAIGIAGAALGQTQTMNAAGQPADTGSSQTQAKAMEQEIAVLRSQLQAAEQADAQAAAQLKTLQAQEAVLQKQVQTEQAARQAAMQQAQQPSVQAVTKGSGARSKHHEEDREDGDD